MTRRQVGAQPLTDRDWVFGSRPRRLLLERTLKGRAPTAGWTKTELAALAGVSEHGGVDEHVAGLIAIGLLEFSGRRLVLVYPRPGLAAALSSVVRELGHVPDERRREPAVPGGAQQPVTGSDPAPGRDRDGRVAARRELRRARSAVLRAVGISDATRTRAIEVLEEALGELDGEQ